MDKKIEKDKTTIKIELSSLSDLPMAYHKAFLLFKEAMEEKEIYISYGDIVLKKVVYSNGYDDPDYKAVFEITSR